MENFGLGFVMMLSRNPNCVHKYLKKQIFSLLSIDKEWENHFIKSTNDNKIVVMLFLCFGKILMKSMGKIHMIWRTLVKVDM